MKTLALVCAGLAALSFSAHAAEDRIDSMRGSYDLTVEPKAPSIANVENTDIKRTRNYPMQPPTIPHKIDDYQVDLNANKCLSCHSRQRTEESQAPMVSVTHFMDRDGNFLAEISPRRYFCNQCHVPLSDAKPLVENSYQDASTVIEQSRKPQQ